MELEVEGRTRRRGTWLAGFAAVGLAVGFFAGVLPRVPALFRPADHSAAALAPLPAPVGQRITRTNPGAQVAWLSVERDGGGGLEVVGVGPDGKLLIGPVINAPPEYARSYGTWRSADGSTIFVAWPGLISTFSAFDGRPARTYPLAAGSIIDAAFSPDGRWGAVILFNGSVTLQVIDLQIGAAQAHPIPHRASSSLWGTALFSRDSRDLYTITDWSGPTVVSSFGLRGDQWMSAAALDDPGARCPGPPKTSSVASVSSRSLVFFCGFSSEVWVFELPSLTRVALLQPRQVNPFSNSPAFTPDGQLVYVQEPAIQGPDKIQVVDLGSHRLIGPLDSGYQVSGPAVLSPDGLVFYLPTADFIVVQSIPHLERVTRLAPGLKADRLWLSGDGRTLYAIPTLPPTTGGTVIRNRVIVVPVNGSNPRAVGLPGQASFV